MKNKIKYIVLVAIILGGLYLLQSNINNDSSTQKNDDIQLDDNGKQIIDDEGNSDKDKETTKGKIDKSKLTEEELREYESYDPLGGNATGQETESGNGN